MERLATKAGSGAQLIVVSPEGQSHEHLLKFTFKTSNEEAEYKALLARMDICNALGAGHSKGFSDSQLVVS